jgi:hypothetical protein
MDSAFTVSADFAVDKFAKFAVILIAMAVSAGMTTNAAAALSVAGVWGSALGIPVR